VSTEVEELVRETYAAHQILMTLGYDAEEIDVVIQPTIVRGVAIDPCITVQLHRAGKRFVIPIAPGPDPIRDEFLDAWRAFATTGKRAATLAELDCMLYGSVVWQRKRDLLTALVLRGFPVKPVEAFG
jgi:hypothetical protein